MKQLRALGVLIALLVVAWPRVAEASTIVGLPADTNTGNCFPFGCSYTGTYQQVYTSSEFAGTLTITGLEFFNTAYNSGATAMNSGNWDIYLSTTSADWNTLSGTFNNNLGADNTLVFSGNLSQPWAFGNTLSIALSTAFTYDSTLGNLLLTVIATGTTAPGGLLYFDANSGNNIMGRVFSGGSVTSGYGLVTGFTTSAVPEPATLLLLGTGLGAVAARRRLKKRA